jgi:hypothetical protein
MSDYSDDPLSAEGGWISWSELQQLLDTDTLQQLRPHLTHTGLDGQPCVERDRLGELLTMLDQEGRPDG